LVLRAYHASHAQFAPSALIHYVRLAEHAGFIAVSSSAHLQPWSILQGRSGFAWARLQQDSALAVSQINLHNVNREQEAFIDAFGGRVLPALQHA
jgi:hypothetical protein